MPASMMSAEAGGKPKVKGSSIATVVSGEMPGNTPTSVPIMTPAKQNSRVCQLAAVARPSARLSNSSTRSSLHPFPAWSNQRKEPPEIAPPLHQASLRPQRPPEREWQAKTSDEQQRRKHGDHRAAERELRPANGRRGRSCDQHGPDASGDQPQRGEQHRKQRDRCQDHDERSPRSRWTKPGPISPAVPTFREFVAPKATSANAIRNSPKAKSLTSTRDTQNPERLLHLDAGLLDNGGIPRRVGFDPPRELRGRTGLHLAAQALDPLGDLWHGQNLDELGVEALVHRRRRSSRGEQALPGSDGGRGDIELLEARQVVDTVDSLVPGHRKSPQLALRNEWCGRSRAVENDLALARDRTLDSVGAAPIRYVLERHAPALL